METLNTLLGGGVILVFALAGIIVLFLWMLLPFAVFGIKQKLDELIRLQGETNRQMTRMVAATLKKETKVEVTASEESADSVVI